VLWATDGSEAAERALPYARSLTDRYRGTLLIVHCEEASSYGELRSRLLEMAEVLRAEGMDVRTRITSDSTVRPAHGIREIADELNADVIVVGTRGHSPLAGVVVGSVTQRLLRDAPCPVLAVPPG